MADRFYSYTNKMPHTFQKYGQAWIMAGNSQSTFLKAFVGAHKTGCPVRALNTVSGGPYCTFNRTEYQIKFLQLGAGPLGPKPTRPMPTRPTKKLAHANLAQDAKTRPMPTRPNLSFINRQLDPHFRGIEVCVFYHSPLQVGVCTGSSDHSLLVDGISTNISDIMNTLTFINEFQR